MQWVLQLSPGSGAYAALLLFSAGPSLVVLGVFGAGLYLGGIHLAVAMLFSLFSPFHRRP